MVLDVQVQAHERLRPVDRGEPAPATAEPLDQLEDPDMSPT
jgi:hypothetical protein